MTLTVGSLFAGIGGFDLAARRVGWTTRWYSEVEPYACAVMEKHFPEAVNLGDIRTITSPPPVDVLVGGFPCQDISHAGKRAGLAGERSGLWREYARLIDEVKPTWIVAENVAALRTRGLGDVLRDLDALGYVGEWHCIPAAAVGAPHRRDRIWIIARRSPDRFAVGDSHSEPVEQHAHGSGRTGSVEAAPAGALHAGDAGCSVVVAHAERTRLEGHAGHGDDGAGRTQPDGPARPPRVLDRIVPDPEQWATEPPVGRVAYGLPAGLVRSQLQCLGNAIVPQVAEVIFRAIIANMNH